MTYVSRNQKYSLELAIEVAEKVVYESQDHTSLQAQY
jgi:hypothetical protein